MNLKDLISKMTAIEEGAPTVSVEECGEMPVHAHNEQPDNITMNIAMNGQGEGGIRSLMNILRDLESEAEDSDDAVMVVGDSAEHETDMAEVVDTGDKEFGNSMMGAPGPEVKGIPAVTATGNDLASTGGKKYPKVNGAENPMAEGLVDRLSQMYQEIKLRESVSTMHRYHAGAPKVDSMEHEGHGEFTATVNGEQYHVYAPIDFGSSHDDIPEWLGSVDITAPDGSKLHHSDPIFRAIDDELDKLDPADLGEYDHGAAIDMADYSVNSER